MSGPVTHRHDEMHRGLVPESQIAEGTPAPGDVPAATGYGFAAWVTPESASAHIADTTDAHDASAISADTTGYGNSSASDVQGVLDDFDAAITAAAGGGSGVATDPIWDNAGDLAVGTGSNTAAKLALGNVGSRLARINGAVAWDAATSNPGSAATGDRAYRSDLKEDIVYDGTRWLGPEQGPVPFAISDNAFGDIPFGTSTSRLWAPVHGAGLDQWITRVVLGYLINTTNDGTRFWSLQMSDHAGTAIGGAQSTVSEAANTWITHDITVAALAGVVKSMRIVATKTSTPGTIYIVAGYFYRPVIT